MSRRVPRSIWLPKTWVFVALALAVTAIFAFTPLDQAAARIFYRAQGPDHWPLGKLWPWSMLYGLAPLITASLIGIGMVAVVASFVAGREAWRKSGVFLILSIIIGPGLIINTVFKDHWDRPRPREVLEFGGALHYTVAPLRGAGGGSFPCGHCSVGFLYASGWWLWKRRRPRWARASLALGIITGLALGLGRMAAGAHFLSDVVWSALLALGFAHVLYYHILRLDQENAWDSGAALRRPAWLPGFRTTILAMLGATLALAALFVTPHGKPLTMQIDFRTLPLSPRVFEVSASTAEIEIVIDDFSQGQITVDGELHGFGLSGSRLGAATQFRVDPVATLSYRIEEDGWITDLSASATIHVAPGELERIVVQLQRGSIHVTDATRTRVVQSGALQLDLHTQKGDVTVDYAGA
jgi:lipid A 4'-phosphatase